MRAYELTEAKKNYRGKSVLSTKELDFMADPEHNYLMEIANKALPYIQTYCGPWLKETDNGKLIVYRGDNFEKERLIIARKHVRQNRKPSDTPIADHKLLINYFQAKGFIANRHNSTFTTANEDVAGQFTSSYIYVVMPVGDFNYTWSPKIGDLTYDLIESEIWIDVDLTSNFDELLKQLLDVNTSAGKALATYQGDDDSLKKAIKSGNEIMIHSDEVILIKPDVYEYYILPMLQGKIPKEDFASSIDLGNM